MEVYGNLESQTGQKRVRFYVSKNIPSFFAKASAGICTAEDVELFLRKDHFHINLVDDETEHVIGNVQAYLMEKNGQTLLMLRGINPTTAFVTQGNAGGIIEGALTVGKELVEASGFGGLYLSEPLGGAHAHTNRPEIGTVLINEYFTRDREIILDKRFAIKSGTMIERMYTVYENPNVRSVYIKGLRHSLIQLALRKGTQLTSFANRLRQRFRRAD